MLWEETNRFQLHRLTTNAHECRLLLSVSKFPVNSELSADQVISMKVHLMSDLVLVFSLPQEPAATAENDDSSDNSQFTGSTINLQDLE